MNANEFPARPTILIGGRVRDKENSMSKIALRAEALKKASCAPVKREPLPGEENQLMLPGVKR